MQNNESAHVLPPIRHVSWPWVYVGGIALYAVSIWAGFKVFAVDHYPGAMLCYATLALISLGATAMGEALYDLIDAHKGMRRLDHFALMALAGLLLTACYGPRIFIKFYEYDDWIYMPYQFEKLGWAFLNEPINDHYVPLLKVILYFMSRFSDPTYYGNSVVFYLASMLVLTGLGRVVRAHVDNFHVFALAALSFALWPTFEGARTWFGGGFWLALPVAAFLGVILAVRRIATSESPSLRNYLGLATAGLATVLCSSQILIPWMFIFVYALPYWNGATDDQRPGLYKKGSLISLILLAPTAIAFFGRSHLTRVAPNLSGLFDGAYFTNLALFVKAKVGFDKLSTTLLVGLIVCYGAFLLYRRWRAAKPGQAPVLLSYLFVMTFCGLTMPKMGFNEITTPFWLVGLLISGVHTLTKLFRSGRLEQAPEKTGAYAIMLCGLSMLLFYILQVGVGRRWGISTALADYYVMFPMAGFWLFAAGFLSVNLAAAPMASTHAPTDSPPAGAEAGWPALWPKLMPYAGVIALGVVFVFSLQKYLPTGKYIEQVMLQKGFVRDLGLAACSEARLAGADQRLFVRARLPFTQCRTCGDVLHGPESFVFAMSDGGSSHGGYFQLIGNLSARRLCPDVAGRLAFSSAEASKQTDGESAEWNAFYRKYYE